MQTIQELTKKEEEKFLVSYHREYLINNLFPLPLIQNEEINQFIAQNNQFPPTDSI